MINYICNTTKSNQIFITNALNNNDAIFAPNLIHAGPMTIIDYIGFAKSGFKQQDIQPMLDMLEITDSNRLLSTLPTDKQMLVHYFTHLIIDREHILIELPSSEEMDALFISLLFKLIESVDFSQRRLTIITNDSRISSHSIASHNQNFLPIYTFNPTSRTIIKQYIGRKITILASLFLAVAVVALAVTVDAKIVNEDTEHLLVPHDLIAIQNTSSGCEFNQFSYNLELDQCPTNQQITYSQVNEIVADDRIKAVYFDDKNHIQTLNEEIATGKQPIASIPDFGHDFSSIFPTFPCVVPDQTAEGITCEKYNPENSLISKATVDDRTYLQQNIESDPTSAPDYIFLETFNNNTIAKQIATNFPSINVYTAFTAHRYIAQLNSNLLLSVIFFGTIASFIIAVCFFLLMDYSGFTVRGLRYRLMYQTGRPTYVRRLYVLSEALYFGSLIFFGSLISINATQSWIGFGLGLYFGVINALFWIIVGIKLSPRFSIPEKQLLLEIKLDQHINNK